MTKILCVEDEKFLREDIAEELEDAGYEVLQAADGREGLAKILAHGPDLVLSDITMPNMDGYELLEKVRQEHDELAEMPIIFMSALSDRDHVLEGMRCGADDYLIKPIDFELMLVKVEASLRQSQRFIQRKEEEAVKLYMALTKPVGVVEEPPQEASQIVIPAKLPPLNMMCIGELEPEFRIFNNMLSENHHKVSFFTSEEAYFDMLAELPIHVAFLWNYDHDQRRSFKLRASKTKPKNIVIRVVPRQFRKRRIGMQADANDLLVRLPVKMRDLSNMISGWISQRVHA